MVQEVLRCFYVLCMFQLVSEAGEFTKVSWVTMVLQRGSMEFQGVTTGLQRGFGGLPENFRAFHKEFSDFTEFHTNFRKFHGTLGSVSGGCQGVHLL